MSDRAALSREADAIVGLVFPKRLRSITELDRANVECPICLGEGWVCENHDDKPWGYGEACCGGAGMPCRCNLLSRAGARP